MNAATTHFIPETFLSRQAAIFLPSVLMSITNSLRIPSFIIKIWLKELEGSRKKQKDKGKKKSVYFEAQAEFKETQQLHMCTQTKEKPHQFRSLSNKTESILHLALFVSSLLYYFSDLQAF